MLKKLEIVFPEGYGNNGTQTLRRMKIEQVEEIADIAPSAEQVDQVLSISVFDNECDLDEDILDAMNNFVMSDEE